MKALIYFHESSDVRPHTTDMETLPREGDMLDLPDVSSRHFYEVKRVIFRLERPRGGNDVLEVPRGEVPAVRIYLGQPIEKTDSES
jgi:hypothetical protein